MIEKLLVLAQEIIDLCTLSENKESATNIEVIKLIKREFEKQYNSLDINKKAIVLNKKRDIWATRTIIDSADLKYNKDLFDKVFEFEKLCKKLKVNDVNVLY